MSSPRSASQQSPIVAPTRRCPVVVAGEQTLLCEEREHLSEGLALHVAASAQAALTFITDARPSLLVLGAPLPDLSPPDLCGIVRSDPTLRNLSILFIGLAADAAGGREATRRGANAVLLRPVSQRELSRVVGGLVNVAIRLVARVLLRMEVRTDDQAHSLIGLSRNISSSGMLIELPAAPAAGATMRVSFFIASYKSEIACEARVVRVVESAPGKSVLGIQFVDLSEADRRAIERYVTEARKRPT